MTMNPNDDHSEIRREAQALREEGKKRREVSLFVCRKLFEAGARPNASTVRSISQFGSMKDVQDDVRDFWDEVRRVDEKTLETVGLPEELRLRFAGGLQDLLVFATQQAKKELAKELNEERSQFEQQMAEKDQQLVTARSEIERLGSELEALTELSARQTTELGKAGEKSRDLEERLTLTSEQLDVARQSISQLQAARDDLRAELQQKTEAWAQQIAALEREAEDRRKPLLLQIDELRTNLQSVTAKLSGSELALAEQRALASEIASQLRGKEDYIVVQRQLGEAQKERIAALEASERELKAKVGETSEQLGSELEKSEMLERSIDEMKNELSTERQRNAALQKTIDSRPAAREARKQR